MQSVTNLESCFLGKISKNINLLSAELAKRVVKINALITTTADNTLILFSETKALYFMRIICPADTKCHYFL